MMFLQVLTLFAAQHLISTAHIKAKKDLGLIASEIEEYINDVSELLKDIEQPADTSDDDSTDAATLFKENCLKAHNDLRDLHINTAHLEWDATLAQEATTWAEHLLETSTFVHESGLSSGENLAWFSQSRAARCSEAAFLWYTEFNNYDNTTGLAIVSGEDIGHFTQMVWQSSSTKKLGVGFAEKLSGGNVVTYIVARYSPAGNVVGQNLNYVGERKTNAVTPTLGQLDPVTCYNVQTEANCVWFTTHGGYSCAQDIIRLYNCKKFCSAC